MFLDKENNYFEIYLSLSFEIFVNVTKKGKHNGLNTAYFDFDGFMY